MPERSSTAVAADVVLTRAFESPRTLVCQVWTDPAHLGEWWGPTGFTNTQRMDLRPGGEWIHVMHGPDGTDYPNDTVFIEVDRPARLVDTNSDGDSASAPVIFEQPSRSTRTTAGLVSPCALGFRRPPKKAPVMRDHGAYEGAHQTLDRLAQHLLTRATGSRTVE